MPCRSRAFPDQVLGGSLEGIGRVFALSANSIWKWSNCFKNCKSFSKNERKILNTDLANYLLS